MIVIAGVVRVRADKIGEAVAAGSRMAATSRAEAGCAEYRFAIDIDDPLTIHLFEHWDDQAALDAHFASTHFAEFSASIADVLAAPGTFTRYEVASAGPLFG